MSLWRRIFRWQAYWGIYAGSVLAIHAQTPPPPMPALSSPVDSFRHFLAMKPDEREKALATRPAKIRKQILEKLAEYDALKPDERELRLRLTQLRWYMLMFMDKPGDSRAEQLVVVPEADRQLVADHLRQWDLLPPAEQKEVLKYETTMRYFVGVGTQTATNKALESMPADERKKLEDWSQLPPGQQQQMYASFQRFFDLTEKEKQKTLGTLSILEQKQMERSLKVFAALPPVRRERCLKSFRKFADMSEAERAEFLQNAERWRELSPEERQAWRNLVIQLPPPMPPPMPPIRRPHPAAAPASSVAASNSFDR